MINAFNYLANILVELMIFILFNGKNKDLTRDNNYCKFQ